MTNDEKKPELNRQLQRQPERYFTKVGERTIATGQYCIPAFLQHMKDKHGPKSRRPYCTLECACKTWGDRVTEDNKRKWAVRMGTAASKLLYDHVLLLPDKRKVARKERRVDGKPCTGYMKILGVKLFNRDLASDRDAAHMLAEEAEKSKNKKDALMIRIIALTGENPGKS